MSGRGKKIDWDDVDDLGKDYDSVLAKRLGVTVKEVFKARKSRKILPFAPADDPVQTLTGMPSPLAKRQTSPSPSAWA